MTKKPKTDFDIDFTQDMEVPKLSTTAMNLDASTTQLNFFSAAESLSVGESCLYKPSTGGPESKKRCLGMKAWMTWERKRRIKVMSLGTMGGLSGIDPLAGTSMYLDKDSSGNYSLKIIKPEEEQILLYKLDGSVLSSI